MSGSIINIENVNKWFGDFQVLKDINLEVQAKQKIVVCGPSGSGKSTLSNVLAGKDGYSITNGNISFCEENLLEFSPDERANKGIFLAFQYPVEIPGVTNINFIKTALESKREFNGLDPLKPADFLKLIKEKAKI